MTGENATTELKTLRLVGCEIMINTKLPRFVVGSDKNMQKLINKTSMMTIRFIKTSLHEEKVLLFTNKRIY